jgi:hypothetical protein
MKEMQQDHSETPQLVFIHHSSPRRDSFTLTDKVTLKEPPSSNWLARSSLTSITSFWNVLNGAGVRITPINHPRRSKKLNWEKILA